MSYKNPPITEAIFDVQVEPFPSNTLEKIRKIHEYKLKEFPKKKVKLGISGEFKVVSGAIDTKKGNVNEEGFIFLNPEENRLVQFRLNGFTYNVLKPYVNWDQHYKEFLKYWGIYKHDLKPSRIKRIATRYINRIEIPLEAKINEFFKYGPKIPEVLPNKFNNFFYQISAPSSKENINVNITQTISSPNKNLPYILDIDTFMMENEGEGISEIEMNFSLLREVKNSVFEDCITDKTRKFFK